MLKKIYILPETKIEEYIVLSSVICESQPTTNTNIGGEGGEDDFPTKERGMEYGNIW